MTSWAQDARDLLRLRLEQARKHLRLTFFGDELRRPRSENLSFWGQTLWFEADAASNGASMAEALILLLTQDAADLDVGAIRLLGAHLNT